MVRWPAGPGTIFAALWRYCARESTSMKWNVAGTRDRKKVSLATSRPLSCAIELSLSRLLVLDCQVSLVWESRNQKAVMPANDQTCA